MYIASITSLTNETMYCKPGSNIKHYCWCIYQMIVAFDRFGNATGIVSIVCMYIVILETCVMIPIVKFP